MLQNLLEIKNLEVYFVAGILLIFGVLETASGFLANSKRTIGDWVQEVLSFLFLSLLIKPAIVLLIFFLGSNLFGTENGFLADENIGLVLIGFLIVDDFLQYAYHRFAHQNEFFWKLHRTHHQAEEMGFFVSYRNAALYYVFMPNIYWIGVVTFLGGGIAVSIGLVLKLLVIIGSHSTVKWDQFFYNNKSLHPVITVLERIFVTPAFHHAHHGRSRLDNMSDPNGNFGNMLSIWDQLFGTAFYTRKFPMEYGLHKPTSDHWSAAYLYPVIKSEIKESEISKGYKKIESSSLSPVEKELTKDQNYLWCKCGKSKDQPFCDGSHHGSKFKPVLFQVKRTGSYKICNCKLTKTSPFCDNSHLE